MITTTVTNIITGFIESIMPTFCDNKLILYFNLDCRFNDERVLREIIIHRPNNYTKVLTRKIDDTVESIRFLHKKNEIYFEKVSDHDSCWKDDGFQFVVQDYFDCAKKQNIAAINMNTRFLFMDFYRPVRFYLATLEPVKEEYKSMIYVKGYNVQIEKEVKLHDLHKYIPENEE